MDVLVDFCRTGELAPLRKGMTAAELERLLGPPRRTRSIQGEDRLQRYWYGSLSLTITCLEGESPDKEHLLLRSLGVSFDQLPLDLPGPIAQGLTHPWASSRLEDVLGLLHGVGVETTLTYESSSHGTLYQQFSVGQKPVSIVAFEGGVSKISGGLT